MTALFERPLTRRQFLRWGAVFTASAVLAPLLPELVRGVAVAEDSIPTRPLGKTGVRVTILGLGGEGILRTWGRGDEAVAVIHRALERGITYCDTAPAYSGSQDYYGEALGKFRDKIFLASKTHERTRDGSLRLLEQSLKRLRTDALDLWQLHDLTTVEELDMIFSKHGAIHALEQARHEGMARFLGITGHYDPAVLVEAIRRYPFDTVLVALNVADRTRLSFIDELLPVAHAQELGIIGMKVLARGALLQSGRAFTMSQALGYVLSLPISTAIVGFRSVGEVDEAIESVRRFTPFSAQEMERLEALAKPFASEANWFKRAG